MTQLRKYLHENFKMTPMDPTATRQLRNLLIRNISRPSEPIQQLAHGRSWHNSAPGSQAPYLDDSLDDD